MTKRQADTGTGHAHGHAAARLALVAVMLTSAGCGASGSAAPGPSPGETRATVAATARCGARGASLLALIGGDGRQVSTPAVLIPAAIDLPARIPTRISLGLLDKGGDPITADGHVTVYLAPDATSAAYGPFDAHYEKMEAPEVKLGASSFHGVVVATVTIPKPGGYLVAGCYTVSGAASWASGAVQIVDQAETFPIGARAPKTDNPTLSATNGDVKHLTTRVPPDLSLLQWSIAASLRDHAPFVVVFATPALCTSRMCGPVVDVVRAVQTRMQDTPMRFIHVEIYQDNDPSKGYNQWVKQWRLPSEPWVFVVGRDGVIRAKFEGALGVDELEQAAREGLR